MGLEFEDRDGTAVLRYELMLKGNAVVFFDSFEFEDIIVHYLEQGELQKARKALCIALDQHPDSSELKLLEVEILVMDLKLDKAQQILDDLSKIEPNNSEISVQRANLLSRKGDYHQAIIILKSALSVTDDPARVYYLLAMQYLQIEDYHLARVYFEKCLKIEPENKLFLQQLMFCYDFSDEVSTYGVIDFLERYLKDYPYNEVGWLYLGRCYADIKDFEKAISCYDYAILSDDTFCGGYFEKAKVLEQNQQYDKAIECYEKTLQLEDPTPYVYLRIGKCYEKKKDFDQAEVLYRRSIYEDPQFDQAWFELSKLSVQKGNWESGLRSIEKALIIDKLNLTYHLHRIQVCELLKNTSRWIFSIEEACEVSADSVLKHLVHQFNMAIERQHYDLIIEVVNKIKERLLLL